MLAVTATRAVQGTLTQSNLPALARHLILDVVDLLLDRSQARVDQRIDLKASMLRHCSNPKELLVEDMRQFPDQ